GDLELDGLALLEVAVARALDRAEMHEDVWAVRLGDEAVALLRAEPLHGAGRHEGSLLPGGVHLGRPPSYHRTLSHPRGTASCSNRTACRALAREPTPRARRRRGERRPRSASIFEPHRRLPPNLVRHPPRSAG